MPLDPEISLASKAPPPVDPLGTYGKVLSLSNLMQTQRLRDAQITLYNQREADVRAQAQQRDRDLNDAQTIQESQKDPNKMGAFLKGDFSALAGQVAPENLDKFMKGITDVRSKVSTIDQTELENHKKRLDMMTSSLAGLQQIAKDAPDQYPQAYHNAIGYLQSEGYIKAGDVPATAPSPDQLPAFAAQLGITKQYVDAGLEHKLKTQQVASAVQSEKTSAQALSTSQTQQKNLEAELPGKVADSKKKEIELPVAEMNSEFAKVHHGLNPEQYYQHQVAQGHLSVAEGQLQLAKTKQKLELGEGGADNPIVKGWVDTLKQNPDAIKELSPALRNSVQMEFQKETGLPLPVPLGETQKQTEVASRNALDNIKVIDAALSNPRIREQLGPLMGRLGNQEQHLGSAVFHNAEDAKMAQELRTRMRYFVFQEGKGLLGGRMPQQLMKQLEESSASTSMDPKMLEGALEGARSTAVTNLSNMDKARFGGKARSNEMRGVEDTPVGSGRVTYKVGSDTYMIPKDKEASFKAHFPDAKAQ